LDRLTLFATHALSSALLGFALTQHPGSSITVGILSGIAVFLCLRHLHDSLDRRRDKRELAEDLQFLHAETVSVRASHDDTKNRVIEITTALARRMEGHEKKIARLLQFVDDVRDEYPIRETSSITDIEPQTIPVAAPVAAPAIARTLTEPAMLELVRRALEENRVDLYLQPIVNLPQRKVRFYEALTRLRSADGSIVMPSQFIQVAAPAGLMSVVDNLLLFRCIQLVRRLTQKTRDVAVFCNISEHTLTDPEFFPQFLEFLRGNRDLAAHIVFEFAQDTLLQAGKAAETGLKSLQALGFRLSLDQVSTLNCNFAKLRAQGFHFIKVKARMLISGMNQANAPVPAEDFKELLQRCGIDLIVERVEEEKAVVQLLEFNIGYGQGFLFGEPKPIRDVGEIHDPRVKELTAAAAARSAPGLARRLAS
jgi:cyclic-di-GMP phosphodiesterase TipF (flagellum assembly factor)